MAFKRYTKSIKKPTIVEKSDRFIPEDGWNAEFESAFNFVQNDNRNGAILAVAGGGKTTAIVESCMRLRDKYPFNINKSILVVAFNTSIRDTLAQRLAGWNIEVRTIHQHGFKSLRSDECWGGKNVQFDIQQANGAHIMSLVESKIGPELEKLDDRLTLCKLVSMCKTRLATNQAQILETINRFGYEFTYPMNKIVEFTIDIINQNRERPGTTIVNNFGKGKPTTKKAITFDDMVWLPIEHNWPVDQFDIVFIDEAQDLSPARIELIKKSIKPGGRIIAVADERQCIYSFAGADVDALDHLMHEIEAVPLPLSTTFRCAKNVVTEAAQINNNIVARLNANDGIVDKCEAKEIINSVKNGDVILSRTNAPLVRLFFKLAKKQANVKFIGKDYGLMLQFRINTWKAAWENKINNGNAIGPFSANVILEYNDRWLNNRKKEYSEKEKAFNARLYDEHATVCALTMNLTSAMDSEESYYEIIKRCNMFSPDETAKDNSYITLATAHKFKGLERRRAFLLMDTFDAGSSIEEANILYVAITRAEHHLTYVTGKIPTKETNNETN